MNITQPAIACSKLTSVSVVNFEQVNAGWVTGYGNKKNIR